MCARPRRTIVIDTFAPSQSKALFHANEANQLLYKQNHGTGDGVKISGRDRKSRVDITLLFSAPYLFTALKKQIGFDFIRV